MMNSGIVPLAMACLIGMSPLLVAQAPEQSPFGDLLEGIATEPQAPSAATDPVGGSPLGIAYQAMLRAQQQLQQGDVGDPVDAAVDAQQTAIDALDSLLQQLQQPPPPQPPTDTPPETDPSGQSESEQAASPDDEGEPAGNPQPAPRGGDSPSEDQLTGDANTDPAALERSLQQSVWGHLPDRVRQQLQASMPDEFHPRYRRAISDYFRQLSQTGTTP